MTSRFTEGNIIDETQESRESRLVSRATDILDDQSVVIFDGTEVECLQLADRLCEEVPELFDSQDAAMEFITDYYQDAVWHGLANPRIFTYQPDE